MAHGYAFCSVMLCQMLQGRWFYLHLVEIVVDFQVLHNAMETVNIQFQLHSMDHIYAKTILNLGLQTVGYKLTLQKT